ncbi:MAG TPA: hypothetical protein VKA09_13545 [Nitrososphaeraceae archaeon]|jgi:Tol biopolymer transport system component|nr:hypothetical protein [Nitrososphaeraceae archaeon]
MLPHILSNQQQSAFGTFPGENGKIAFSSTKDGSFLRIHVMNADGSGQTNISNNPAREYDHEWSPDGTKIVFGRNSPSPTEIYVMNADGSDVIRLTMILL